MLVHAPLTLPVQHQLRVMMVTCETKLRMLCFWSTELQDESASRDFNVRTRIPSQLHAPDQKSKSTNNATNSLLGNFVCQMQA
jgi:hypothetical protein